MLAALVLPLIAPLSAEVGLADLAGDFDYQWLNPSTVEEARLAECLDTVNASPTDAIGTASAWLAQSSGAEQSYPRQCLGIAYTRLLRWKAAEDAFLAAHADLAAINPADRARLAAMAGNAAMAEGRSGDALKDFDLALQDAEPSGQMILAGEIQIDRSAALVALGREEEASQALGKARALAPQNAEAWLLSATLARRQDDLSSARSLIGTAGALDPANPAIGLEAGVIAVLSGDDATARKSWESVLSVAPTSPEAATARDYLAQLEDAPAP